MPRNLDTAELAGWRAYIEASQLLLTRLEEELRRSSNLTLGDYHVLVLLSEAPGQRLRMGELAERLIFSPSRLTYQISTMERRDLVRRQPCPADRRGSEAVLTPTGLSTLRAAAPHHLEAVRSLFVDDLDADALACLTRVFTRLGNRLRSAPEPAGEPRS